ncbi:MFS transporter [Streptomyces sp. NPDC051940]|uniref:MFS transporter n=1 Tax=Streptomyces sp. NPDC051940 TaxID=3155675 RepID=UPI00341513FA
MTGGGGTVGRRPLVGLLAAVAVSLTGSGIAALALPWFVLETTGSATRMGVAAFCEAAPYVLVKALSGPFLDRLGPRRISWATDLVSASAAASIALLHTADRLSYGVLLALLVVVGAARGPGDTAKEVMVPEAARLCRVPLERATGLLGAVERLSGMAGPLAGGALVVSLGAMTALAVNAAAFLLGSLIVALSLPRGMGGPPPAPPGREEGYLRQLREAPALLRTDRLLLTMLVMLAATNLLDAASGVLMPVWARESGRGAAVLGVVAGVWSAAAVAGSLVAAATAHRLPRRTVFFAGFLLATPPKMLVLALDPPIGVLLAVIAAGGFAIGFVNPVIGAIVFERIPAPLLGRAQALGSALSFAGIPLGVLLGGAGAGTLGLVPMLLTVAALYVTTVAVSGLRPQWRELNRPPQPEVTEAA